MGVIAGPPLAGLLTVLGYPQDPQLPPQPWTAPNLKDLLFILVSESSILIHTGFRKSHSKNIQSMNVLVMSNSFQPHGLQPIRLLCPQVFSRQEYWGGLPCPPSGDLPNPGIKPRSPALQADLLPSEPPGKPPKMFKLPYNCAHFTC